MTCGSIIIGNRQKNNLLEAIAISLYYQLACNYYKINDMENTLNCLEKATQHAIDFDTLASLKHHTSLVVHNLKNHSSLVKSYRYNECYHLLHGYGLAHGKFKAIREDARYKAVISQLEKYSKAN